MKEFINYFLSPFVRPKIKFYLGRVAIGTPYFYPRRAVKDRNKPGYMKFVNKKIGFDVVKLGWKTKWSNTDYRFEWSPLISFVFFKWQIAVTIQSEESDHYWESWLYYQHSTDKNKSVSERVNDMVLNFPQTYKVSRSGKTESVDYYQIILKKKWRPKKLDQLRNSKLKDLGI